MTTTDEDSHEPARGGAHGRPQEDGIPIAPADAELHPNLEGYECPRCDALFRSPVGVRFHWWVQSEFGGETTHRGDYPGCDRVYHDGAGGGVDE